jgi:hypothetical protein
MNIELHLERGRPQAAKLTLDGVDITHDTHRDGITLDLSDTDSPRVTVTLLPKALTVSGDMFVDFMQRAADEQVEAKQSGASA